MPERARTLLGTATVVLGFLAGYAGCSASGGGPHASGGAGGTASGGAAPAPVSVGSGGSGGAACDPGSPAVDDDLDGFSEEDGDCNDCDPNANPNAMEVVAAPGENLPAADEDCDGLVDEPAETCDADLALDSLDPLDAARALELCKVAGEGADWGLVSAAYVNADGTPATPSQNVGLLPKFGDVVLPRAGDTMVGLSTGHSRDASQPDNCGFISCNSKGTGVAPAGFPQVVPYCPGTMDVEIEDDVALELTLRAPSNAKGYAFDFAFFSFEFPKWVCSAFNDQFIALVDPAPPGAINGNICFDDQDNPVSVNLGLFDHCDPASIDLYADVCQVFSTQCPDPPNPYCPNGHQILAGTGFDAWDDFAGSTGWLSTTAPLEGGDRLRIRFAIWDAADAARDSTVIIDDFRWLVQPSDVVTLPVPR